MQGIESAIIKHIAISKIYAGNLHKTVFVNTFLAYITDRVRV